MSEKTPLASFDEVRALLAELPGPESSARAAAVAQAPVVHPLRRGRSGLRVMEVLYHLAGERSQPSAVGSRQSAV